MGVLMNDLKFLNALNRIPGVGPATLRALKNTFGSFENAWRAEASALEAAGGTPAAIRSIIWKRPSINPDRELEKLIREEIWMITEEDPGFPPLLKEIPKGPLALYGRGTPPWGSAELAVIPSVAVVGTRKPTQYGLEVAESIAGELAEAGVIVTSGLAVGIDTRAHEAALSRKGKTIAVIGSGLDDNSLFPPQNRGLVRRIVDSGGAVISEYALGTPALREHFPARNRIIAGISRGVLVVEAREKSGALITARLALEQNRDIFAIPGAVFSPTSAGPHALIREGALLVTSGKDILEALGISYTAISGADDELFDESAYVLLSLLEEPSRVDDLMEKTGLETPAIVAGLSALELRGKIRRLDNDTYQKIA